MKQYLITFIGMIISSIVLVGCGHSVFHRVDGTGVYGRVPLPDGSSLVEIAIGNLSITSGVLRGGAMYNEDNSKGGTFGTVSTANHIQLTTQPAMNEGYLADVFTSDKTDAETKLELAKYLTSRQQHAPTPASAVAVNAAAATGEKPPVAKPVSTGLDNAVNKVTEVAPKVVTPIADATKASVADAKDATTAVVDGVKSISIYLIIGVVVLGILVLIGLFIYYKKKHNTANITDNTPNQDTESIVQNDTPTDNTVM